MKNITHKEIEKESLKRYPDSPERGFGTGDYEFPESHENEREAFVAGAEWMLKNKYKIIFKKIWKITARILVMHNK